MINYKKGIFFLIFSMIYVGTTLLLMPIGQVPDEMNHARMSWETIFKPNDESFKWMKEIRTSPEDNKNQYFKEINNTIDLSKEKIDLHFSIGTINHLPQIIGMFLMLLFSNKVFYLVIAGRIVNSLVYCIGCYYILRKLRFGQYPFMFISLLPIMVQQAASLSYDVVNYLAIGYFFALITILIEKKVLDWKLACQFFISALFLYASKINNVLLIAILPFIDAQYQIFPQKINDVIKKTKTFIKKHWKVFTIIFCTLVVIVFFYAVSIKSDPIFFCKVLINTLFNTKLNGHLNSILTIGIFGYIGNFVMQFPLWFIFIDLFALFIFMFYNPQKIFVSRSFGFLSAMIFPIQVCMIITGMYFLWTPIVLGTYANISVGAQGRYFTPFLLFFVPFIQSLKKYIKVDIDDKWIWHFYLLMLAFNYLFTLILIIFTYWYNIQ